MDMMHIIEAILFDMGDTLQRITNNSTDQRRRALPGISRILESEFAVSGISIEELDNRLLERAGAYKRWSENTLQELPEEEMWARWMLPDLPREKVRAHALELNAIWRKAVLTGQMLPEAKEVVTELFRRGYRLGVVSNTTHRANAPEALRSLGIAGMFETVVLSCVCGIRKPHPGILLQAAREIGVPPERCAYIGDQPERDVAASRKAGFAKAVIIQNSGTLKELDGPDDLTPDHTIHNLTELLELFPERQSGKPGAGFRANDRGGSTAPRAYDVSFSSMWALKNFHSLEDFFRMAPRLGFASIELNHQIDSSMFDGVDFSHYRFSSVHEPCPADISTQELKNRDWMISSLDEDKRRQGVLSIKRSIDLARQLGVKAVVVHPGHVRDRWPLEKKLYDLYRAGASGTGEYLEVQRGLAEDRAALVEPHLEAVRKSLLDLLEYAGKFHIRLGLENRYHYMDIPLPDEMEELLRLANPERLGFWYDVGHAQVLDRLGYHRHQEWLERFSGRMIGVHLHDVVGIDDHQAPGTGEVDFSMVARHVPAGIVHTCELGVRTTPEQVRGGLQYLAEKGIIECL